MPIRQSLPLILGLVAALAGAFSASAQGPAAKSVPKRPVPDRAVSAPMAFFIAHGAANACGHGCSEWIAAEGRIMPDSAERFGIFLAQLGAAKPPIFLHSPGGSVIGSIELGQLIRTRKMTVSIGHTLRLDCDHEPASQTWGQPSGQPSCPTPAGGHAGAHGQGEMELDLATSMCNSACVYVLAGGTVRLIPPWVSLGIHDMRLDPASAARHSEIANELGELTVRVRLRTYLQQMGIDDKLLTEAFAIPSSTVGRLSRDDAARFGLDRRAYAETPWVFVTKPSPAVRKYFFLRTTEHPHFINGFLNVGCEKGTTGSYILAYIRDRLPSDVAPPTVPTPIAVNLNDKPFSFFGKVNDRLYIRSTRVSAAVLEELAGAATVALPGAEFGRPANDVTLPMDGFAAEFAKLPEACIQAAANSQIAFLSQSRGAFPATPMPPLAPGATVTLPVATVALKPGVKRAAVDATLGAPSRVLGTTALYSYTSSDHEPKVMAGYFDKAGTLQRFARYALKDGKIVDEMSNTELTNTQELFAVRALLTFTTKNAVSAVKTTQH